MCIGLVAIGVSLQFPLIVIHNRDEFHSRKSLPPKWHESGIFSGIDEQSQGTWIGIDRAGYFSFITNYRDPRLLKDDKKSRGHVVFNYLTSDHSLNLDPSEYNNFNLIAGNRNNVIYFSSMKSRTKRLSGGVYALSNAYLDTPWPKVRRIKELFNETINNRPDTVSQDRLVQSLFNILTDEQRPLDRDLPSTGISIDAERLVSSIFVRNESYGTRASTVILQGEDGYTWIFTKEFNSKGEILYEKSEDYMAILPRAY